MDKPEFLADFIELYRSYPCLWNVKHGDYFNKQKRLVALLDLLKKCKSVDNSATEETVKKKIHNIRSVYKKELKKIRRSQASGAGESDIYKPSLWYYKLLYFLDDQEIPRMARETIDEVSPSEVADEDQNNDISPSLLALPAAIPSTLNIEQNDISRSSPALPAALSLNVNIENVNKNRPETSTSEVNTPRSSTTLQINERKRRIPNTEEKLVELIDLAVSYNQNRDEFQSFGVNVGDRLRKLDPECAVFAKKLISDVLFLGERGVLSADYLLIRNVL